MQTEKEEKRIEKKEDTCLETNLTCREKFELVAQKRGQHQQKATDNSNDATRRPSSHKTTQRKCSYHTKLQAQRDMQNHWETVRAAWEKFSITHSHSSISTKKLKTVTSYGKQQSTWALQSLCAQTRWLIFNGVLFSAQNIRKPELSIKIII